MTTAQVSNYEHTDTRFLFGSGSSHIFMSFSLPRATLTLGSKPICFQILELFTDSIFCRKNPVFIRVCEAFDLLFSETKSPLPTVTDSVAVTLLFFPSDVVTASDTNPTPSVTIFSNKLHIQKMKNVFSKNKKYVAEIYNEFNSMIREKQKGEN